jgi:hypothetical protein
MAIFEETENLGKKKPDSIKNRVLFFWVFDKMIESGYIGIVFLFFKGLICFTF